MPKVSQQYRDARREQILDAAGRCFARDGFHQTSMQDLFAEAGLSSGAVYRYFPSKADMIVAITQRNVQSFVDLLRAGAADDAMLAERSLGDVVAERSLGDVVADMLESISRRHHDSGLGGLALTVWAEGVRDETIAQALAEPLGIVRQELTALAQRHLDAGRLPAGADPAAVASLLMCLVPGFLTQMTLYGDAAVAGVPATLRAIVRAAVQR